MNNMCLSNRSIEVLTCKLKLTNTRDIFLIVVYRPPDGDVKEFCAKLEEVLLEARTKPNVEILIGGDINIDSKQKRQNKFKIYNDFLKRNYLSNLIAAYTHFNPNEVETSAVDHFLSSDPELYASHGIVPYYMSDHYLIFCSRKKVKCKSDKIDIVARNYNKYNPDKLAADLAIADWSDVFSATDVDSAWNNFVMKFESILNTHAPWQPMSVPINSPEWVTHEFISECKARDHFNIYAKRSKNPLHLREAKRRRNKVNQIAKNMKRLYFTEQIKQAGKDSKKLWRVIKQLLRTGKKRVNISELNGKENSSDIANEFNKFFCDIRPDLASKILESLLDLNFERTNDFPEFNFTAVTDAQVHRIFKKMSTAKATGCDGIPIKFSKCNLQVTVPILTYIINLSLTTLKVPQGWKKAEVIPLFKEGSKSDPSNYRPISVLPAASKILEKCVHMQVYSYLSECNILSKAQFGFRKAHSTTTCILSLLDYLYKCMDNGKMVGVVFLDLKKAFDTVDHDIMLNKLQKYGLSMNAVEWFRSYLTGRVQTVKVNGKI